MNTVLKKAGIVLAAATAGVLAVSPLAFAGDYNEGDARPGLPQSPLPPPEAVGF